MLGGLSTLGIAHVFGLPRPFAGAHREKYILAGARHVLLYCRQLLGWAKGIPASQHKHAGAAQLQKWPSLREHVSLWKMSMTELRLSFRHVKRAALSRRGDDEQGRLTESWGLMAGWPSLLAFPALVGWGGSYTTQCWHDMLSQVLRSPQLIHIRAAPHTFYALHKPWLDRPGSRPTLEVLHAVGLIVQQGSFRCSIVMGSMRLGTLTHQQGI